MEGKECNAIINQIGVDTQREVTERREKNENR